MSPEDLDQLEEGLGRALRRGARAAGRGARKATRGASGKAPWNKGRKNFNWKEWQHARGRDGRFIDMPGKLVKSLVNMRHGEWRELHELVELVNGVRGEGVVKKALVFRTHDKRDSFWEFRWVNKEGHATGIKINVKDLLDENGNNDPDQFLDKLIHLIADLRPEEMEDWLAEGRVLCACGCRNYVLNGRILPGHDARNRAWTAVPDKDKPAKKKRGLATILGTRTESSKLVPEPKAPKELKDGEEPKWSRQQRWRGFDANGNPIPEDTWGEVFRAERHRWATIFGIGRDSDVNSGKRRKKQKEKYEKEIDRWVKTATRDYEKRTGRQPTIVELFNAGWRKRNNVSDPPAPDITDSFIDDDADLNDKWGRTPRKVTRDAQKLAKETGRVQFVYIDPTKVDVSPTPDGTPDNVQWSGDERIYVTSDRLHWDDDKGLGDDGEWTVNGDGSLRPNLNSPRMAGGMLLIRQIVGPDGQVYEINARKGLNQKNLGEEFVDVSVQELKDAFDVQETAYIAEKLSQLRIDAANFRGFQNAEDGLYIDPRTDEMARKIIDHINAKAVVKIEDYDDYNQEYNPLGVRLNKLTSIVGDLKTATVGKKVTSVASTVRDAKENANPKIAKGQLTREVFDRLQKELVNDIVRGRGVPDDTRPFRLLMDLVQMLNKVDPRRKNRDYYGPIDLQSPNRWTDADLSKPEELPVGTNKRERSMYTRWIISADGRFAAGKNSSGLYDVFFRSDSRSRWTKSNVTEDVRGDNIYRVAAEMVVKDDIKRLKSKMNKYWEVKLGQSREPAAQRKIEVAYDEFWGKLENDMMKRVRELKRVGLFPQPGGHRSVNTTSVVREGDPEFPGDKVPDVLPDSVPSTPKTDDSVTDPSVRGEKTPDGDTVYPYESPFDRWVVGSSDKEDTPEVKLDEVKSDEPDGPKYTHFYKRDSGGDGYRYYDRQEVVEGPDGPELLVRLYEYNDATGEERELDFGGVPLTDEIRRFRNGDQKALLPVRAEFRKIVNQEIDLRNGKLTPDPGNNEMDREDLSDVVARRESSGAGRREVFDEAVDDIDEIHKDRDEAEFEDIGDAVVDQIAVRAQAREELRRMAADPDHIWGGAADLEELASETEIRDVDLFEYDRPKEVRTNAFGIQEGVEIWVTPAGDTYRLDYDTNKDKYRLWHEPDGGDVEDVLLLDGEIAANRHSMHSHNMEITNIIEAHHKGDFDPDNNRFPGEDSDLDLDALATGGPSRYDIEDPKEGKDVVFRSDERDDFFYRQFGAEPNDDGEVDISLVYVDKDGKESVVETYGAVRPAEFDEVDARMREDAANKADEIQGAGQWQGNLDGAAIHRMRDIEGNEWRIGFYDESYDNDGLPFRRGELVKVTPDGRKEVVDEFIVSTGSDYARDRQNLEHAVGELGKSALKAQLMSRLEATREEIEDILGRDKPFRGRAPYENGDLLYATPDGWKYAMRVGGNKDVNGKKHSLYATFRLAPNGEGDYDIELVGRRIDYQEGEDRDAFIRRMFGPDVEVEPYGRPADAAPDSPRVRTDGQQDKMHKRAMEEVAQLLDVQERGGIVESTHLYENEKGDIWTVRGKDVIDPDGKITNWGPDKLNDNPKVGELVEFWNNDRGFIDKDMADLHKKKQREAKKEVIKTVGEKPSFKPKSVPAKKVTVTNPVDAGWEKKGDNFYTKGQYRLHKRGSNWVVVRKGENDPVVGGPTMTKAIEKFDALDLDDKDLPDNDSRRNGDSPDIPDNEEDLKAALDADNLPLVDVVGDAIPLEKQEAHPEFNSWDAWQKVKDANGSVEEAREGARGLYVWYDAKDDGSGRGIARGWDVGQDIPDEDGIHPVALVPPYSKDRGQAVDVRPVQFPGEDKLFADTYPKEWIDPDTGKAEIDVGRVLEEGDDFGVKFNLPGNADKISDQLAEWNRKAKAIEDERRGVADALDPEGELRREISGERALKSTSAREDAASSAVVHTKSGKEFFTADSYDDWRSWSPSNDGDAWTGPNFDGISDYSVSYQRLGGETVSSPNAPKAKYTLRLIDRNGNQKSMSMFDDKPSHEWMQQQLDWHGKGLPSPHKYDIGEIASVGNNPKYGEGVSAVNHIDMFDPDQNMPYPVFGAIDSRTGIPVQTGWTRAYKAGSTLEEAKATLEQDGWVLEPKFNVRNPDDPERYTDAYRLVKKSGPDVEALQEMSDDARHAIGNLLGNEPHPVFPGKVSVVDGLFDNIVFKETDQGWVALYNLHYNLDRQSLPPHHIAGEMRPRWKPNNTNSPAAIDYQLNMRGLRNADYHMGTPEAPTGDSHRKTSLRRVVAHEMSHLHSQGREGDYNRYNTSALDEGGIEEGLVEVLQALVQPELAKRRGDVADYPYSSVDEHIRQLGDVGSSSNPGLRSPYYQKIQLMEWARHLAGDMDREAFYRELANSTPGSRSERMLELIVSAGKTNNLSRDEILDRARKLQGLIDDKRGITRLETAASQEHAMRLWDVAAQRWRDNDDELESIRQAANTIAAMATYGG